MSINAGYGNQPYIETDQELDDETLPDGFPFDEGPPSPPESSAESKPDDVSQALAVLDRLHQRVEAVPSLDALNAITAKAIGLQRLYSGTKEVADRAGEVWIYAERRLGEEIRRMHKHKGGRPPNKTGALGKPVSKTPEEIEKERQNGVTLAEIGLKGDAGKRRSVQTQKLANLTLENMNQRIAELKAQGKGVTPAAVLKKPPRAPDRPKDPLVRIMRAMAALTREDERLVIKSRVRDRNFTWAELKP